MTKLEKLVAAHPIRKPPYNAIKLARIDGNGTPLYTVAKEPAEVGAAAALKLAFEKFGGHCFHCKTWMKPQRLSQDCTRDHLKPRADGGLNQLHNLVIACGRCNRGKGRSDIISFDAATGRTYLDALEEHLARCMKELGQPSEIA